MERGNLNGYINKFKWLARLTGYGLDTPFVLDKFGRGLVPGLYAAIVNGPDDPITWTDWVRLAQRYQQKYLLVQSNLEGWQVNLLRFAMFCLFASVWFSISVNSSSR